MIGDTFTFRELWFAVILLAVLVLLQTLGFSANSFASVSGSNTSTADHTKFEQLKKDFKTGQEVTQACLSCHTEASRQIHRTIHWNWRIIPENGQQIGKVNIINNY